MYVIKINCGKREYVGASSPDWLSLLNDTVKEKRNATKFSTKKQAEKFVCELIADGYKAGCSGYLDERFSIVRF